MTFSYTPFTSIPKQAIADIEAVIDNDEGGFVLTSNKDDPDGGWTYAGIITSHWQGYLSTLNNTVEGFSPTKSWFLQLPQFKKKEIAFEIYFAEFYEPMAAAMGEEEAYPFELSCAINCGLQEAIDIHKLANSFSMSEEEEYEVTFLREWMKHYIKLVQENAEAWRACAEDWEAGSAGVKPPATLRAVNLLGWFNRVERYRGA